MDAKAVWKKGLSFTGSAASSGFSLPLGSDEERPEDGGFRPMELLLVGLAGCTGMDVISILEKKRQEVTSFEVRVHAERAPEHPKVFTLFRVEYVVKGKNLDEAAVKRAAELSETKYCSAMATLRKAAPIESKVTILS